MRMLLHRDNPFRIKPRPSSDLIGWLTAFRRSARPDQFKAGADAILSLNDRTLALFDELRDDGVSFEMHDGGIVFLFLDRGAVGAAQHRFAVLGYPGEIERLDGDGARALEPAVGRAVQGALHIKPERFIRPETLTRGLHEALVARGADVRENVPVRQVRRDAGGWVVVTREDEIRCAKVVVAAGIWSLEICRRLGVRLVMQPGKGYSLTTAGTGSPPRRALFFVEAMIGAAPYDGAVRLAGMLELAGMDPRPHARRIELLRRAARSYLQGWEPGAVGQPWAGLRPLPPDGLPIVGPVPGYPGAFLATGHGMVGVTLAPASGELLAKAILEDRQPPGLAPFSPARF
jgi:D-amino-acid dehydrogenase